MKMALNCSSSTCITFSYNKIRNPTNTSSLTLNTGFFHLAQKSPFRVSAATSPAKARFVARRKESVRVRQLQRPLIEYMSLPASQYSVLDAERIERVDDNTFRSSMINRISCDSNSSNSEVQQLTSDAFIEVSIEVPFAFRAFPVEAIESTGTQVLDQILKLMLPRFMSQVSRSICYSFIEVN
ncbi:hypothetical protein CISIN_1g026771mg [Citrus sinensis]|uniref:Uncharacterized protein n=1 Tax=Citrus sinensis TaxID=2711 RepID=A0A067DQD3_CITSI|nr:hypothetical protein CISIN_1g026771mg [Citrus sinensis]